MLYPSKQLVLVASMVLLGSSLVYALVPGIESVLLLLAIGFVLFVVLDANRSFGLLGTVDAIVPARFSLSVGRQADYTVQLLFSQPSERRYRIAIDFPDTVHSDTKEFSARAESDSEKMLLSVSCSGVKRGLRQLESVHLGTRSKSGFWELKKAVTVSSSIQVYPNILLEQKRLSALFVRRGVLGSHATRLLGKGRDFEKLREYVPGDGFEDIHWKATAKRNKPITKVFQVERTQEIYIVIDASRLSGRDCSGGSSSSLRTTFLERNLTVGLMLATVAERMGDHFGFFAYSDRVDRFLRASSGRHHFDACRDVLYRIEPSTHTPDFRELLTSIRLRLRHRSLIIMLVALDDALLQESFLENIDVLRRQHLVVVVSVRPSRVRPLFENGDVKEADEIFDELNGHEQWRQLNRLQRQLKSRGVDFLLPSDDEFGPSIVNQYIDIKRRQRL